MGDRQVWEIRCAKHPAEGILGAVFTPRASALCRACRGFVTTEGKPLRPTIRSTRQLASPRSPRNPAQDDPSRRDPDPTNADGVSFRDWRIAVDQAVSARIGVGASDLADYPSWSLWDACIDPSDAASECIEGDDVFGGHGL